MSFFTKALRELLIEDGHLEKTKVDCVLINKIDAIDEKGNKFPKDVKVAFRRNRMGEMDYFLHFDSICRYYLEDSYKWYPADRPLCIDMGGRNHGGYKTRVRKEDLNKIIPNAEVTFLLLQTFDFDEKGRIELDRCQKCLDRHLEFVKGRIVTRCLCDQHE